MPTKKAPLRLEVHEIATFMVILVFLKMFKYPPLFSFVVLLVRLDIETL